MKIYIMSAVLVTFLAIDSCADEQYNANKPITTYDPGELTSNASIGPRLPSFPQITAGDHPGNQGLIRFEDQPSGESLKFKDVPKENGYTDQAEKDSVLTDVSFDNEENLEHNDRILHTNGELDDGESRSKFKFEGNNDDPNNSDHLDTNEEDNESKSQVVFEGDTQAHNLYSDDSGNERDSPDKKIKFENQDDKSDSNGKDSDSERSTVTERVTFIDDTNNNQKPVKRKPRRKPRVQTLQGKPASMAPNSPYPGLGYYGYPGAGYPNAGQPSLPVPGYPTPSYPYPPYPSPYSGTPYPTPIYPGYPPYAGTVYPPMNPGYGLYTPAPLVNSVAYPNSVQGDQSAYTGIKYPSQGYTGSTSPGAPQSYQPGIPYPTPGYPGLLYHQAYPNDPNSQYPIQPLYRPPGFHQQGYQNPQNRPSRRPKSLTERAVSAVAEALTSIALYDDYQCVPKMLCEIAGGRTTSSPALLKATASLQPLLTLLQAYNGISSSPLFIFGRAAVTGMTAKGNPAVCRYAYPQCPNDPEKLINYLNNHNGGFFRFFGQPEVSQKPQNLEQFYKYLSGQYGLLQQPQPNYDYPNQQGYGLLAQNYPQNYRNGRKNENEIEERIQNKPGINVLEDDNDPVAVDDLDKNSKWLFPDETHSDNNQRETVKIKKRPERAQGSKTLKFPDDRSDDRRETKRPKDYPRKEKHIFFPGESYFAINSYYQTTTPVNYAEYVFDHKHNFYVKKPKAVSNEDVVYVVRGNGDPNHPEIVKVRPGQRI